VPPGGGGGGGGAAWAPLASWLPDRLARRWVGGAPPHDWQCRGPSWLDTAVAGRCDRGHCNCPVPWAGLGCTQLMTCVTFLNASYGWSASVCVLDIAGSTAAAAVCSCSVVGSLDVLIVESSLASSSELFAFVAKPVAASLSSSYMPPPPPLLLVIFVLGIDFAWLVVFLRARALRSSDNKKDDEDDNYLHPGYDAFWSVQHMMRLASNQRRGRDWKEWLTRTYNQLRAQHKLLRLLYRKHAFENHIINYFFGEDVARLPTGTHKATVLAVTLQLQMAVLAWIWGQQPQEQDGFPADQKAGSGLIAATIAMVIALILDHLFWKHLRITQLAAPAKADKAKLEGGANLGAAGSGHAGDDLVVIGRAALSLALAHTDFLHAMRVWKSVTEDLHVEEIRAMLIAKAEHRAQRVRSAADEKAAREMALLVGILGLEEPEASRRHARLFGHFAPRASNAFDAAQQGEERRRRGSAVLLRATLRAQHAYRRQCHQRTLNAFAMMPSSGGFLSTLPKPPSPSFELEDTEQEDEKALPPPMGWDVEEIAPPQSRSRVAPPSPASPPTPDPPQAPDPPPTRAAAERVAERSSRAAMQHADRMRRATAAIIGASRIRRQPSLASILGSPGGVDEEAIAPAPAEQNVTTKDAEAGWSEDLVESMRTEETAAAEPIMVVETAEVVDVDEPDPPATAPTTSPSALPFEFVDVPVTDVYKLGQVLGEGATATVHCGTLIEPGRTFVAADGRRKSIPTTVAIKTLEKSHPLYSDADVQREITCMRAASGHPNVVGLYEVYYTASSVALVLQLATGGELFDAIVQRGSFSEAQAISAVRGLCLALSDLHGRGIVHRDLKADNLLVDPAPEGERILLTDFGLARVLPTDGSLMREACGSPAYAAPEILAGEGYSGTACDMWSVGVIVFMLLCGYPPFYAEDLAELFDAILSGEANSSASLFASAEWDDIEPQAKDLISGLLQTEPSARMSAAEVLEHSWITSAGGAELSAVAAELKNPDGKLRRLRATVQATLAGGRLERALGLPFPDGMTSTAVSVPPSPPPSPPQVAPYKPSNPDGRPPTADTPLRQLVEGRVSDVSGMFSSRPTTAGSMDGFLSRPTTADSLEDFSSSSSKQPLRAPRSAGAIAGRTGGADAAPQPEVLKAGSGLPGLGATAMPFATLGALAIAFGDWREYSQQDDINDLLSFIESMGEESRLTLINTALRSTAPAAWADVSTAGALTAAPTAAPPPSRRLFGVMGFRGVPLPALTLRVLPFRLTLAATASPDAASPEAVSPDAAEVDVDKANDDDDEQVTYYSEQASFSLRRARRQASRRDWLAELEEAEVRDEAEEARQQERPRVVCRALRYRCRTWRRTWRSSVPFWHMFPWLVSIGLLLGCNVVTFCIGQSHFAGDGGAVLVEAWGEALAFSLLWGLVLQDVIVIVLRNNLRHWFERFCMAPLVAGWTRCFGEAAKARKAAVARAKAEAAAQSRAARVQRRKQRAAARLAAKAAASALPDPDIGPTQGPKSSEADPDDGMAVLCSDGAGASNNNNENIRVPVYTDRHVHGVQE